MDQAHLSYSNFDLILDFCLFSVSKDAWIEKEFFVSEEDSEQVANVRSETEAETGKVNIQLEDCNESDSGVFF